MSLLDEIQNLAGGNASETDSLINDGEQWADQQTGNQLDDEVKQGGEYAENYLGADEQQGN